LRELAPTYNSQNVEDSVQKFWIEKDIQKSVEMEHAGDTPFFFVDGPPYTTGHIHLGTAWNKVIKDSILRYHRMCGRHVIARAGYDMHGLPIEVRVEQELGFKSKKDIEEYGIASFIERCQDFSEKNRDKMSSQFKKLGVWLDFDDPYQTIKPEYIEAAWWTLAKAHESGKLERGFRVVNWCPRCETAIADAEVEYWDERDPSVFVKFPIIGKDNEFLVIWTTTPWTLPANVAVAVHQDINYVRVKAVKGEDSEVLWIAKDLVKSVLKKGRYTDFSILSEVKGDEVVGLSYESPLSRDVPMQTKINHIVVSADFVALENTGLVHIAPGHGWDDYVLGTKHGLSIFCPVDESGRFTSDAGIFSGKSVRESNKDVLMALGSALLAEESVVHRYGHCWRCKTPIIFRATSQWFLKVSEMRDKMLNEVAKVIWYPEWAGSARFYDWIKDARDWCISRQRFWGIPIPIWVCDKCGEYEVIGRIHELEEKAKTPVPNPHRPYVDLLKFPCSCGGEKKRVQDIFDVWFDSAVASWATLGYPQNTESFKKLWPADFITEGQDQTRGWFYSQLGASTIAFDCAPYKSVLMHGFALDSEGRKMSKSLGNVVTPEEVIEKYGVDILRLYLLSANAPWDDLKFNWDGVKTVHRALNIYWNVCRFPLPYMILDKFTSQNEESGWDGEFIEKNYPRMPAEDRYIISRISTISAGITEELASCNLHRATRSLTTFVLEDLSRWYIQLVRERMWDEEESDSKQFAYQTMYYVMRRLNTLFSPFTPYLSEECYQAIKGKSDPLSVHLLPWWKGEPHLTDPQLEAAMQIVRNFDDAQANARQNGKRKLRWPVMNVIVSTDSPAVTDAILKLNDICKDRANSRNVTVVNGRWERIGYRAEPIMKALGPSFGKEAPKVRELILSADGNAIKEAFSNGLSYKLKGSELDIEINEQHVMFHEALPPLVYSSPMTDATVYVDLELTEELEAEGYAREVIRRIQEMRRQAGLVVEDWIDVTVVLSSEKVTGLISGKWIEGIKDEVRAVNLKINSGTSLEQGLVSSLEKEWNIEGINAFIAISRKSG